MLMTSVYSNGVPLPRAPTVTVTTWPITTNFAFADETIRWESDQLPPPSSDLLIEWTRAKAHWAAVRRTRLEQVAELRRSLLLCRKLPPERPVLAWPCPQQVHRERAHRRANPVPGHPRAARRPEERRAP